MPTRHSTVGWDFPRSSTRRITQDSSARKAGPPFRFRSRRAASKTAQSCTSKVNDWTTGSKSSSNAASNSTSRPRTCATCGARPSCTILRATGSSFITPGTTGAILRGAWRSAMMPGNPGSPILVILGSSRSRGNTRMLVDAAFPKSNRRLIDLGSHAFSEYGYTCANHDEAFAELADVLVSHQWVVLATPVYWYTTSATMKRFVDRLSDLVTIRKSLGRALAGRRLYVVATSADPALPTASNRFSNLHRNISV